MLWLRMAVTAWRLAWPHVLTPWRSPLLRWRMETYGVVDDDGRPLSAGAITPRVFLRFLLQHRADLVRFLRWAATLSRPG